MEKGWATPTTASTSCSSSPVSRSPTAGLAVHRWRSALPRHRQTVAAATRLGRAGLLTDTRMTTCCRPCTRWRRCSSDGSQAHSTTASPPNTSTTTSTSSRSDSTDAAAVHAVCSGIGSSNKPSTPTLIPMTCSPTRCRGTGVNRIPNTCVRIVQTRRSAPPKFVSLRRSAAMLTPGRSMPVNGTGCTSCAARCSRRVNCSHGSGPISKRSPRRRQGSDRPSAPGKMPVHAVRQL